MRSACLYRSGPDLGDRSPTFFWRRSLWSSLSGSSQLEVVSHNRHGCARVDVMSMAHKGVNCPRPPPLLTRVINDVTNPRTHYPRTPPTEHGRSGGSCAPKPPRTAAGQLLRVWPPATSSALAGYRREGWIVIDPSVCSPWGFINGVLRQGNSLSGHVSRCRRIYYKRPSSRARLTAAPRCSTPSLRYTARWCVFTVLSET